MITEDYCSFEVAKLLKEKGFDELCDNYYDQSSDEPQQLTLDEMYYSYDVFIKAPTHQMAMKWLREVHNLFIEPYVVKNYSKKKLEYTYSIQDLDFQGSDDGIECCKNWDTPEQACETAIKYCLENLI